MYVGDAACKSHDPQLMFQGPTVEDEIMSYHREERRHVLLPKYKVPSPHQLVGRRLGLLGSKDQREDSADSAAGGSSPLVIASCSDFSLVETQATGFAFQTDLEMLMFEELVLGSPLFSLFILLKDLFWTGLLFLLHRHLHQSGVLTMEALQDPPPDPVEGMEEDIADKVGPAWRGLGATCRQQASVSGLVPVPWPWGVGPPWAHGGMWGEVPVGRLATSWRADRAQQEVVMVLQALIRSCSSPAVLQHFTYVEEDRDRTVSASGSQPKFYVLSSGCS